MSTDQAPANDAHDLYVVMNGRVVGDIQRTGKNRARLRYESVEDDRFTPLSISMSDPGKRYRERALVPWLDGLLPDRPETLRQWRRQFGVVDLSPMALLAHVGEDVAGAAQFVRPSRLESALARGGGTRSLSEQEIAEMLRRVRADLPVSAGAFDAGKFSLAGAQAKIALHQRSTVDAVQGWANPEGSVPSTHIVKPAIPQLEDQDLIEHVTMRTAAGLGLRGPAAHVEQFEDVRAVVVRRYDRAQTASGTWVRLHQEDMCQALGVSPSLKYESQGGPSASMVATLIRDHAPPGDAGDAERFVQALIFNWLICGTDAHARNYSVLLQGRSVRLAPMYDVNSLLAYSDGAGNDLSMSVQGTFRADAVDMDDWTQAARSLHVEPEWIRGEVARQRGQVLDVLADVTNGTDVATYASPVVRRLVKNARAWVKAR